MSKCENCLSQNVCRWWESGMGKNLNCTDEVVCPEYKNKSIVVELPCKAETKQTNFDKITESVESLAEFIIFVVNESKNQRRLVSKILKDKNGKNELKKTIKEWLQKECE